MAQWTAAYIDSLPDSAFAYIEPGGTKDSGGRTVPRSKRHFPIRDADGKPDAAHVRNALARLPQSAFEAKARPKVEAAAKELGIGQGKAVALKAEPMDTAKLDRWLAGKISRRILVTPFYGPVPGPDGKGRDLDGEYFHPDTDFYGRYPSLLMSRQRLVDWHHTTFMADSRRDPVGDRMKGAILGHIILDEDPEDDGLWADFWANAGEQRRALVAALERRGAQLYGSSQPIQAGVVKAEGGRIDVWPIYRHTITTSPQNTNAIVPALKAALGTPSFDEIPAEAVKAFLTGLEPDDLELLTSSLDPAVAAADGAGDAVVTGVMSTRIEAALRDAITQLGQKLEVLYQ